MSLVAGQCEHQGSVILALSSLFVSRYGINSYVFCKGGLLAWESFWCGCS